MLFVRDREIAVQILQTERTRVPMPVLGDLVRRNACRA